VWYSGHTISYPLPKKTETIRHVYSVRYPADKVLAQSDSGGD
jgi:hypothetical protein